MKLKHVVIMTFPVLVSALCTRVNGNPAPVIRFMQFHYCNSGTGADDAFVLKRGV